MSKTHRFEKSTRDEIGRQMPPPPKKTPPYEESESIADLMAYIESKARWLTVISVESDQPISLFQAADEGAEFLRPSDVVCYEWQFHGAHDRWMQAWAQMSPENLEWILYEDDLGEDGWSGQIHPIALTTLRFLRALGASARTRSRG